MELRDVIALSLMALGGAGCSFSTGDCENGSSTKEFTQVINTETVPDCESACIARIESSTVFYVKDVRACTLEEIAEVEGSAGAAGSAGSDRSIEMRCTALVSVYCKGRRPLGYEDRILFARASLGEACAVLAELEAASVIAFEELAESLKGWGAPRDLIRRCEEAAEDERMHTQLVASLALENGHRMRPPRVRDDASADLETVARHNALEGCVSECWAALLAHIIADRARTPKLRRIYRRLAEDETRHGQLAWDLHRWFADKLDTDTRLSLEQAQRSALASLSHDVREQLRMLPPEFGLVEGTEVVAAANVFSEHLVS